MIKSKYNILRIILLLLVAFLLLISNFFSNIQNIFNNNFDKRIEKIYGFCGSESVGYLKYIKKKYQLNDNPKIINYIHTPNVNWVITNPKTINTDSKNIILLNYPGSVINLGYTTLSKNTYEIKNFYFYHDKINKINSIILFFKNEVKQDFYLELSTTSKLGKRRLIKKIDKANKFSKKVYQYNINLDLKNIGFEETNLIIKINNSDNLKIDKIEIQAKNKINIEDFKLIDQFEKCYLIRKDD